MTFVVYSLHTGYTSQPMSREEVLSSDYSASGEQVARIDPADLATFATSVYEQAIGNGEARLDLIQEVAHV